VAGSGSYGYGGDGGLATSPCVKFADPHTVREDADGNLFISDQSNNCIRKVDTSHVLTLMPAVVISTLSTNICSGASTTFNASLSNGSVGPAYQWKINGVNAGTDSAAFNTTSLNNNDVVTCEVTTDVGCTPMTIVSNSIIVTVSKGISPSIDITSSDDSICSGSDAANIIFTATFNNAGTSPFFQWQINGINVGTNSPVYSSNNFTNNDQVACILTANGTACQSPVSSNVIAISVKDSPVVFISPSDTSVIAGSQVQLIATVNGSVASYNWAPPELLVNSLVLTPVITKPLSVTSSFSLQVTNADGCISHHLVTIKIYKPLLMPSAFTPNDDGVNDVFRIPTGTQLTLIDFSIYNRWGSKVFSTRDISKGWNGKVSGASLPTGTFVYIINGVSENKKIFYKGTFVLIR